MSDDLIRPLVERVASLQAEARSVVRFGWATVTGLSPLRVRVDGDDDPIPFTLDSLIDPASLEVDDRVRVEFAGARVIVHARAGGVSVPDGTIPIFADKTALDAWTPTDGHQAFVSSDNRVYVRVGGTWVGVKGDPPIPFAMAAGQVSSPGGGSSASPVFWDGATSVTFPSGRFSVAPRVTATVTGAATGAVAIGATVQGITSSGFTIRQTRVNGAPTSAHTADWIAVQMTSGAASG